MGSISEGFSRGLEAALKFRALQSEAEQADLRNTVMVYNVLRDQEAFELQKKLVTTQIQSELFRMALESWKTNLESQRQALTDEETRLRMDLARSQENRAQQKHEAEMFNRNLDNMSKVYGITVDLARLIAGDMINMTDEDVKNLTEQVMSQLQSGGAGSGNEQVIKRILWQTVENNQQKALKNQFEMFNDTRNLVNFVAAHATTLALQGMPREQILETAQALLGRDPNIEKILNYAIDIGLANAEIASMDTGGVDTATKLMMETEAENLKNLYKTRNDLFAAYINSKNRDIAEAIMSKIRAIDQEIERGRQRLASMQQPREPGRGAPGSKPPPQAPQAPQTPPQAPQTSQQTSRTPFDSESLPVPAPPVMDVPQKTTAVPRETVKIPGMENLDQKEILSFIWKTDNPLGTASQMWYLAKTRVDSGESVTEADRVIAGVPLEMFQKWAMNNQNLVEGLRRDKSRR